MLYTYIHHPNICAWLAQTPTINILKINRWLKPVQRLTEGQRRQALIRAKLKLVTGYGAELFEQRHSRHVSTHVNFVTVQPQQSARPGVAAGSVA